MLAVGREFFLEHPKNLWRHRLELEVDLVVNTTSTFNSVTTFSLELVSQEPSFLRERMMSGASDFR
jgi:hypothetical protein